MNRNKKQTRTITRVIPISGIMALVLAALFVIPWISGCKPADVITPTPTPTPTESPLPTDTKTPTPTHVSPTASTPTHTTPTVTAERQPTDTPLPTPSETPSPTPTRTPTQTPSPTRQNTILRPILQWDTIGQSVEKRDISVAIVGYEKGAAVVVIGSIQGDQLSTRDLVNTLIDGFDRDRDIIPENVAFHFIPSINPDGNVARTRRNANNVDLNRNWGTFDWTSDPQQPEGIVTGAGGTDPLSEPETKNLANYLLVLKRQNRDLRVVIWHTSYRIESGGHVYPGYTSDGIDRGALDLAWSYADVIGYAVKDDWAPYETTGELLTWCAEQEIEAIDIIIPESFSGSNSDLRSATMKALSEIAMFP
ncbi:MAG: murein peptide amidase A [Chloroflexi bacterium]|nr:murein peptide amidase A [Chloroflexota bacterium]